MRLSKECELLIDGYLARFRKCLAKNAIAQQDEIVREILMHIRECAEQPGVNVESVLRRLGPAEVLASQYGSEQLIRRAERAFSPLVILKATLELAKRGLIGIGLVPVCADRLYDRRRPDLYRDAEAVLPA